MVLKTWRDFGALDGTMLLFGGPYSNLQATEAMIAEAARRGVPASHAICTGDVVAYCGSPVETIRAVRDWGCAVIAGNCEAQLAAGAADCGCGFEEGTVCDALSAEWFAFASARICGDDRAWMGAAPDGAVFSHRGRRFAAIHGGATDVSRFIWPGDRMAMKQEIAAIESEVGRVDGVIAGHCGVAFCEDVDGTLWINAGVIGMPPHDGTPDAAFAILDGEATLHRLAYDAAGAAAAMAGRASPYRDALLSGWWPSEDVLPGRLRRKNREAA